MATRRFCDICDAPLKPEDDLPLVRELEYIPGPDKVWQENEPKPRACAYVAITNEENHPLTDICNGCKLRVVTDGNPPKPKPTIATLQPQVPADVKPAITPFRLPAKPPTPPPPPTPPETTPPVAPFEPSLPSRRPPAQQQEQ